MRGGTMEAKVLRKDGVVIINLKGYIDIETARPFRDACIKSLGQQGSKVIFNLDGLNFVGSHGIIPFVETLQDIREEAKLDLTFCKVSSEFQKIFSASPLKDVEIFSDEEVALSAIEITTKEIG